MFKRNNLARPAGLEPATYGLEVRCSIQLSYGRGLNFHTIIMHAPVMFSHHGCGNNAYSNIKVGSAGKRRE